MTAIRTEKYLGWAIQALENYCLVRSSGKMKDILRARKEPKAKFKPGDQPDTKWDTQLPAPVDYAIKDYWTVQIAWSKLCNKSPHLKPLLDLVMHVYGSGATEAKPSIGSFLVAAPFSPIRVPLESFGESAVKNARYELMQFLESIADIKANEE